jgi:GT2 family glycosyltransferase
VPEAADRGLRLAIGIATVGRPDVLARTLTELQRQTRPADAIIVCAASDADVAGLAGSIPALTVIIGPRGSSHQRNAILDKLEGFDVAVFFDDDFVACPRYLESVEANLLRYPEVVVSTGRVLADGVRGPGLNHEDAHRILQEDNREACNPDEMTDVESGYGCNMAVRLRPVIGHGVRFDERLPLYAWLEDVDFSSQLAPYGRIVSVPAARGVHLGVRSGRQVGVRLGYSQVANPIYLMRKGTMSWRKAFPLMGHNVAANLMGCVLRQSYVDRPGRVAGNARAIIDLFAGRLDPARILKL